MDSRLPVRGYLLILAEEDVDGYAAELVVWERDRRELRPDPRGNEIVVERHDRDVLRDVEACIGEGLVGAEGDTVVEADERRRFRLLQKSLGRVVAELWLPVSTGNRTDDVDLGFMKRFRDAL